MKKINFKNYLINSDCKQYKHLINEGLSDIKDLVWKNLQIRDVLKFLRIVPDADPSDMEVEATFKFDKSKIDTWLGSLRTHIQPADYKRIILDIESAEVKKKAEQTQAGAKLTVDIQIPAGYPQQAADNLSSNIFSTIMQYLAKKQLNRLRAIITRDKNSIAITTDNEQDRFTAWKVVQNIACNADIIGRTVKILEMIPQKGEKLSDEKKAEFAAKKPEIDRLRKEIIDTFNTLNVDRELTAEEKQKINQSLKHDDIQPQTADGTKTFRGNYNFIYWLYTINNLEISNDLLGIIATSVNRIVLKPAVCHELLDINSNITRQFDQIVKPIANLSKNHRELLRLLNATITMSRPDQKEAIQSTITNLNDKAKTASSDIIKSIANMQAADLQAMLDGKMSVNPTNLIQFLRENNFSFKLITYLKLRNSVVARISKEEKIAKKEEKPFDTQKALEQLLPNPYDGKTFLNILNLNTVINHEFNKIFKKTDVDKDEIERNELAAGAMVYDPLPGITNPCARRRWKLIQDAKRAGSKLYSNKNFAVLLIENQAQLQIFGRNKPKVDTNGVIIANANLRDDEMLAKNMSQTDRANYTRIRDGSGSFVRDGICETFDLTPTETSWCICGAYGNDNPRVRVIYRSWNEMSGVNFNSSYRLIDKTNNKIFYYIILDLKDGRLYMAGNGSFLDEHDRKSGIVARIAGDGYSGTQPLMEQYPELSKLIRAARIDQKLFGKVKEKTENELLAQALANGIIDSAGDMHIRSREQLKIYAKLIKRVNKIFVEMSTTRQLFEGIDPIYYNELPVFDCSAVRDATDMFSHINTPSCIRLVNTDKITCMNSMFEDAVIGNPEKSTIEGLNTESVTSMSNAFYTCRMSHFQMIELTTRLNLQRCVDISYAFTYSYLQSIPIYNTDRVKTATDAFVGCAMLQTIPDVKFKSVINAAALRSNLDGGNYESIFDGCDQLLKMDEFIDELRNIRDFYEQPDAKDRTFTDERGYLIISTAADANAIYREMYKYPGVIIKPVTSDGVTGLIFKDKSYLKIRDLDLSLCRDISNLFYNCSFSIGKITGTSNIVKAQSVFKSCTCGVLPVINLPALTDYINIFQGISSFKNPKAGLLTVGHSFKPFSIGQNLNANQELRAIAESMFGAGNSFWIDHPNLNNIIDYLYKYNCQKRDEFIAEKYKLDESGFATLDLEDIIKNINYIMSLSGIKGIRFSKKAIDAINSMQSSNDYVPEPSDGLFLSWTSHFKDIQIDMQDIVNGDYMFCNSRIKSNIKLINTEKLEHCRYMFSNSTIKILPFDVKNITNITGMFRRAQLFDPDIKWNFEHARTCMHAFEEIRCNIENINLPAAVDCSHLFTNSAIINNGQPLRFSLPSAKQCHAIFLYSSLPNIAKLDIPVAEDLTYAFRCANIEIITEISAPRCANAAFCFYNCTVSIISYLEMPALTICDSMFSSAPNLKTIMRFKIGKISRSIDMFTDTLALLYGRDGHYLIRRLQLQRK